MSGSSYWHDVVRGGLELRKLASAVTAFASSSVGAALTRPPFHEYSFTSSERLLVSALVLVVGFVASHRLWRLHLEVSAMVILLIVSTICAPVAWDHYFAYSPMFVVMAWELEWKGVLAWVGLAATLVMTVPWYDFRHPHPHTWWTVTYAFSARGAIFFVVLAILIASFWQKRPGMIRTAPRADAVATNDAMASDPLA